MNSPAKREPDRKPTVMLFSIALNGYQWHYRSLLKSHEAYAEIHGYRHVSVTKPSMSKLGLEVAWLKISLIIEALKAGYEWVMFLDADTLVSKTTPSIENIAKKDKDIYVCRGFSGRLNSGVLIIKNTPNSLEFFDTVLKNALQPIPLEDDVGWGENGHLIHFAKRYDCFSFLDARWNNNQDPALNDFIRHFSRGPMYHLFKPKLSDYLLGKLCHFALALGRRVFKLNKAKSAWSDARLASDFHVYMENLTKKVLANYPSFLKS